MEKLSIMPTIRFQQLPQSEPSLRGNELKYVSEAIKSG